ncbi:hypothetical protein Q3O60_06815 [Alkalimonas collagenimarina]|uniref:Flagellar protein FliT n=1 Tax=Alkalimonas collagenimarina TaxID=400390 RepID=A0ABT9GXV6_9GAMM|nr:hypothetical protein [Alkalimonas collagenimarina]MDP4535892.1 hypothetical protein [Alkalimonas collagenimarina]
MSLSDRKAKAISYQSKVKLLLSKDELAEDELQSLLKDWNDLLALPAVEPLDDFAEYLQQNLSSLQQMMLLVKQQRSDSAAEILSIQQGRKAKRMYNNT